MLGNFFSNTLNGPTHGPKNLWLKPSGNQFFWCSTTLHLLLQNSPSVGTCPQNLCTICAPFQRWPWPSSTSTLFIKLCDHRHFLTCISWGLSMCGPCRRHNWWLARHHLKGGGTSCRMLQIVVAKFGQLQMVHSREHEMWFLGFLS